MKVDFKVALIIFCSMLTSCDMLEYPSTPPQDVTVRGIRPPTDPYPPSPENPNVADMNRYDEGHPGKMTESVGLKSMDTIDKQKLSHALDKPIGKSTQWKNEVTDVSYTVTPVSKITIKDNPYCRQYNVTVERAQRTESLSGTACVNSSGGWDTV